MYYIAYGSNMNLNQMHYRCPNSSVVGKGKIYGWKLVFNIHADIIPTENEADTLPVVVWEIAPKDWASLDRYEGYPKYYVKQEIETALENGSVEKCVAYVMAPGRKGHKPPYQDYFDVIERGCNQNGIDVEYLYDALSESYEHSDDVYDKAIAYFDSHGFTWEELRVNAGVTVFNVIKDGVMIEWPIYTDPIMHFDRQMQAFEACYDRCARL